MGNFDNYFDKLDTQRAARTGSSVALSPSTPEQAAEALTIGREAGVPASLVAGQPDVFKGIAAQKKATTALKSAPRMSAWLGEDPLNGALAKDDLPNITWFEKQFGAGGRAVARGRMRVQAAPSVSEVNINARLAQDFGKSYDDIYADELAKFPGSEGNATIQADARRSARFRHDLVSQAENRERFVKQGGESLARAQAIMERTRTIDMSKGASRFRDEALAEAPDTVLGTFGAFGRDPVGGAAFIAETAAEFLPVLAVASATTLTTRSPAAGVSVMTGGSFLSESATEAVSFLEEKGVDMSTPEAAAEIFENTELLEEARQRGLTRGLVIAAFDAVSGGVAGQTLLKSPAGDMVAQGIAQAVLGGGGEAAGTAAVGDEISAKDVIIEGLAEFATAPIEVTGVAGRGVLRQLHDYGRSGETAAVLEEIDGMAAQSKVKGRAPDRFLSALQSGGLEEQFIYVPAQGMRELYQDTMDAELLGMFGVDEKDFQEQIASGGDVAVPLSHYAANIAGTEEAGWFQANAVMDPDEMPQVEAEEFNAKVADVMMEAYEAEESLRQEELERRASDEKIRDDMFRQLRAAGRTPDVAQREAAVWQAFFRTMGERTGQDPMSIAQTMGVEVRGPEQQETRRRGNMDLALNSLRKGNKALRAGGPSLLRYIRSQGGMQDQGGELKAMDAPRSLIGSESVEDVARRAIEAGYLPSLAGQEKPDSVEAANLLIEAIREEVSGTPRFAVGEEPDADMTALADALSEAGVDLSTATNEEALAALQGSQSEATELFQDGMDDLMALVQSGASPDTLRNHPAVLAAEAEMLEQGETFTEEQMDGEGRFDLLANRTYINKDGKRFRGLFELIPELDRISETWAGGEVKSERKAAILIGPPAAGKSTIAEKMIAPQMGARILDSDEIKKLIPEYKNGVGAGSVHEESSAIAKDHLAQVVRSGDNIVLPKVGDNPDKIEKQVRALQAAGYSVDVMLMDVEPNQAFNRMLGRFINTGRLVPPDLAMSAASKPPGTYDQLKQKGVADGYALIDNNVAFEEDPIIVETKGSLAQSVLGRGTGQRRTTESAREGVRQGQSERELELFQSAPSERSKAFKTWFGDSKVVDENGDPLVVYHGTQSMPFDQFDFDQADVGAHFFSSESDHAGFFAGFGSGRSGGRVMEVYISIQNPIEISQEQLENMVSDEDSEAGTIPQDMIYDLIERAQREGYDGLIIRDYYDAGQVADVFLPLSPEQIKSVDNHGTFDPNDPRILHQEKRGSIQLPTGGLTEGQTVINLFEKADLSTFLHESGHFFLEAMNSLASAPGAPQQIIDDADAIRKFLGVEKGKPTTTEQHETWARSFEAYLLEGKAPSLELADAFARFKAWLTRIYQSIAGLHVNLTPEIRDVMDRMLATDAEIEAARIDMEMSPLFTEKAPGMSDVDWSTYQRMARRGKEQAEQSLLKRTMAKVHRERQAWYKEELAAVTEEVEGEINSQPVYRLTEMLSNQVWLGREGDVPDMRIDKAALIEQFGDGAPEEISRQKIGGKRAIYGPDGATPGEVAEFFGFTDAGAMFEALQNAGKRKDVIAQEATRRMDQRHGDVLNDGSIEEEALVAIHSDQQSKTAVAEARQIATRIGRDTKGMTARAYRARARDMIGRMSVAQAQRTGQFLRAERTAARKAQDAFGRSTRRGGEAALAEALQAKEQQILNGFLYDESKKAAEEVQKGREKMRAYDKESVRKKLEGGYIEQIDAIIDDFDFRVRSKKDIERAESLGQFVERMVSEGREAELNIDERLMDGARRKHYSRLSVDELRGLFDTIANLDHIGRFKQRLVDEKGKRDLLKVARVVETKIRTAKKPKDPGKKYWGLSALNLIRKPDTILVALDDGEEFGDVYEAIKMPIDRGQATEQKMQVEMATRMDDLFKSFYDAKTLREMQKERQIVSGRPWAKTEILAIALNTGNEQNFKRLTDPNVAKDSTLTEGKLETLLQELTAEDWKFVQAMWDEVNSYWPQLSAVHKRRTGVDPKKVQAKLMVDAPAGVTGGYYPIKYDPSRSQKASRDEATAWDKYTSAGHGATTQVANGMTRKREATGGGRTLAFDLSVPFNHLRETVRFIALSEAVDNAHRVLNHPVVFDAMQETGNADTRKTLNLWLQDTARGPIFNTDLINASARFVKNNFTLARLAFNMKTVILQATGLGQSAVTIGHKNMVRGMVKYVANAPEMISDVMERSAFMSERATTFQKDIYDFMNDVETVGPLQGRVRKGKTALAKAGFWPMIKMQFLVVDMPTWVGAYGAGLEKYNGDDDRAVLYADRMVARAQDSGMFGDRAAIERGTVSENVRQADFIRLFTTLGGYMLTKLNRSMVTSIQARADMREAGPAGKLAVATRAAGDMMVLFAFEAVMMGLLYSLMTEEEDDEDLAKFMLAETASAIVGGIPMVRDAAGAFKGYGGGGAYGSVLEAPADLFRQTVQGEADVAFFRSLGNMVGNVTGLPTTFLTRVYESAAEDDASIANALFGRNPLER